MRISHQKALEHAKRAVYECSFEIIKASEKKDKKALSGNTSEYPKKVTMLAISYHNLGVEEDYCGNFENAREAYYKAYEMMERANGPDDPLTKKFRRSYIEEKNVTLRYLQLSDFIRKLKSQAEGTSRLPL